MTMIIRSALLDEAQALTHLMERSKRHWGYDEAFMQDAASEISISQEYMKKSWNFVLEEEGKIYGLSSLEDRGEALLMENLFIEPEGMGRGYGRKLFEHAVVFGQDRGYAAMIWVSDPNALPFYLRMEKNCCLQQMQKVATAERIYTSLT